MESNSANSGLVAGKTITLVKDVSEVDQYDRLLRYVMVEDVFVNNELVRQGLADIAFTLPT
jgi:micrococcal nuclease